jgi:ATP-dependent RNA circularization protein (DNA/RNA ligase family)
VFDVYNIQTGEYLKPQARRDLINRMGLKHAPVIAESVDLYNNLGLTDIPQMLEYADGKSVIGFTGHLREGVVFKEVNGGFTFKAISNKYLCNQRD